MNNTTKNSLLLLLTVLTVASLIFAFQTNSKKTTVTYQPIPVLSERQTAKVSSFLQNAPGLNATKDQQLAYLKDYLMNLPKTGLIDLSISKAGNYCSDLYDYIKELDWYRWWNNCGSSDSSECRTADMYFVWANQTFYDPNGPCALQLYEIGN